MNLADRLIIACCFLMILVAIVIVNLRLEVQLDDTTYRIHQKFFKTNVLCMECHDNTKPKGDK